MNEIEELYQLLQGKVKTGTLEEFTQRMQDPKSLAAVKKYATSKGFVKPVPQQEPQQEIPVKGQPKQGEFRLPTQEEEVVQAPQMKVTGYEALKPSELAAVKSRKEVELINYKAEIDKLDQDIQTRFSNQVVNPNDPAVLKREELAAKFDGGIEEYEKINTEAGQRLNEPIKTFNYTDPYEFLSRAKKETPQLTSDERKAQAEAAQAPLRGGPVPFSGQDYYLGPFEREQMSNFINTQFADVPEDLRLSLEVYLGKLGERDPNAFERIISRTGEPGQAFKSELLEKTLHGKINEVVQDADILAERIKADKQSQQQMQMLTEAKALIKQLEGKAANQDENDALEQAYAVVEQLKGTTVGQYAQKLEDYDNLFRTYRGVIELYPDELRRRKRIADKYDAVTYKEGDSAITKAKKQAIATWGSVQNAVVDATANFIKTSVQAGPNIARAITGSNQQTSTDEYADRLGSWMDAYLKAPSLNPESSQVFAKDLMGNTTVNAKAIIPATAKTVTDMAMLIYGAQAFGGGKAGLTTYGFIQNYNDLLEEALQQPNMDYRKAIAYASTVGLITAGLETVSPQGVTPSLFSSSKKAALSKLMDLSSKNFGKASSVVVKEILKDVPAENLQEAMQLVSEKILNYGFNTALGTNFDDQVRKEEAYETVLLTSAATTVFGFLNRKSRKQWEAVEAARLLKERPDELEAFLSAEVESGRANVEQARAIYKFVEDVKKQDDAAEAAKPIDEKVEAFTQEKPVLEDYQGKTEIEVDEYFAKDVPSGVIVNWDGKKYEVRTDDKGTTLTLMEEVVEEQPEGESTEVAPQVELKPTKQKLTVEEFNELVQAPQGERVETELENAQVAEYQGKEYKITETQGDQVVLENYAGTARMTVPASEVKPFAVAPLATITIEGQQFKADQKQQQALQLIDQVEQDQIEKINSSNLTDVQKKSQTKAIQEAFKRSRKEILGVKEELKTGQEVYFGGKKVKVKSLTKNTAKVEMDGVVTTVPRSALSLSDTTPLDEAAAQLKQRGHVFTLHAGKPMSKQDTDAYMKTDSKTAKIVGRVKQLLPVLAKSGIKIKVFSDVQSAEEAALELGADPRAVRGIRHDGKEVLAEEYLGNGISQVTYEDGTTANVPQVEIQYTTFNGFFDPKTNTIILNAQVAAASTVEHEFLHPIIESIVANNPELVVRFFNELKQLPEWVDLKDFVDQYDPSEQPIEALIEFTARVISPEFNFKAKPATFKRKVVDFFKRLFGIDPTIKINTDNVLDFATSLKESFEKGVAFNIGETKGGFSIATAKDMTFLGKEGQKNFEKWAGDRPVLSGADIQSAKTGQPAVFNVYHGTTNDFYVFDSKVKGNIEGHLGRVNYFTSDISDAERNYLSSGADLTARIDLLAERLEQDLEDLELDDIKNDYGLTDQELEQLYPNGVPDDVEAKELAYYLAERQLKGADEKVLDLFVKLDNPVVLGGDRSWLSLYDRSDFEDYIDEAVEEIANDYGVSEQEARDDYSFEVDMRAAELAGVTNKLHEALSEAISNNDYDWRRADEKASEVLAEFYEDEIDLNQLEKELRDKLSDTQNEEGELSSSQIISDFFENLGFDGIILTDVSKRFRNMGLSSTTSHVHVFDKYANQIKLADGSNVTFGTSKDIRFSKQTLLAPNGKPSNLTPAQYEQVRTPEFKAWFGDWENDPENASKVVDENGEPRVMYHGTRADFTIFDTSESGKARKKFESAWDADYPDGYMFFISDPKDAKYYGSNVMPVFLNFRYPDIVNVENGESLTNPFDNEGLAYESSEAIVTDGKNMVAGTTDEFTIKSATSNVGSFDTNNPDIRFSKAYHKGTLSAKSEGVGSTISGSEIPYTGYFFVSSDDKLKGRQRAMAGDDIQQIDLSQYNLYNPRTNENYFRVLEALRNIPTIGTPERLEKELDSAISKLPQDLKVQVEENKAQILTALVENSALAEQRRVEPSDGKNVVDKAATVVLKQLGYEGVNAAVSLSDPNLQDPDSTGYGTVVFDIKEGTVGMAAPIRFQKSYEDAAYDYQEVYDDQLRSIVRDYRNGVKKQYPLTLKPTVVERVWNRFIRTGEIDEDQLIKIERVFIRNTALLEINTALSGHTETNPDYILEDVFDDEIPDDFFDWFYDYSGTFSDYGLKPLQQRVVKLLMEENPSKRLQLLDEMLNIIHQRDDLSAIFVDGGVAGLDFIGGYHQAIPPPPPNERRNYGRDDVFGKFSKALTIPEMELSFDKFRDLALLWKAYNPTKSEADFYEYVRANVDKRVNKGFMSAAFNDDATYLQKRKDAELDTRSKNLNAQSRGTLGYMADPNVPQFIKDRLKTEQLRYETEPNSVTEKTVDYIIQTYDLSNAEAVLESIQVPAVRTRLADKLIDRLNKLGRDAATAEEKTEYYYAALKLTENNIHYMRSLGRGIQIHSQYSKMDKEGVAFAVNQMMKINRSGLKKAHKTAIDRMVAYARLVERGQRKALITDEVKTQVLSGGKTKEQIRNLKESAAKKLRAIGAQGFSVAPDRQSLLDYGYYEFLDGRRSKASWVKHMTDRGLSDAADVYDYHNFGTAQNPETLADFSNRVESLSDLIGTPALAQAIGQPLADKINAEHRKRVIEALRDKYKKDLKKKGIAGQMAAALITAVEKGQYDSDVLLDELAKTVGAVELSQDDIKIIDEIYKRAATYPEGRIRDEELAKAWDYIYARSRDSLKYGDMYWSFFYANILSGPGTHALNLIENALNIVLEPTVQIADQITRVNTQGLSRRTVAWNMASGVLRGLFGAGVREGLSVVVTGKEKFRGANKYFDSNALEQIAKGTAGKGLLTTILRPAATVMRYVPRALAAADAFYNQAHFEMGSATVAAQIVRQEVDTKVIDKKDAKARYYEILGDSSWWVTALRDAEIEIKEAYRLQGKELTNDFDTWYKIKTRAREIVLNKRQEAASKYVYNDIGGTSSDMAAIGTYTNAPRGVLGAVATHAAGLVADVPIARHVIPFVNIVANVYNRQLDYTPWGLARAAAILTKGGKSDFIAEGKDKYSWNTHEGAAKQHIIKSVMGTAAMIAAYLLFWDDDDNVFTDEEAFTIHGRGPTDYAKKKEMEARGWKPYSFQYKGKFYAFNWTPFNLALSFIANAIDKQRYGKNDEDKSALDNTLIAFNLLGSTLLSAAFVKSAADFLSFFQEGKEESDRLWNFLGRTAISSAPAPMALFNTIHSTVDNTKYQADSVSQGILRNIPIAKTQLKPALNAFGEVITKTGISQDMTWYRVGELTGLNRFMSSLDTNDATFAWLHQNGLWPPVIGKTKELFGNKVSDETHYKLVEICGPNIKRMIEFDKAYIDKLITEDGVAEANKYINQKLKDRIVDFVEDAIIDQYNFKPDEETIIELKDVDWEKVRKYVTDATNEMMVPVE